MATLLSSPESSPDDDGSNGRRREETEFFLVLAARAVGRCCCLEGWGWGAEVGVVVLDGVISPYAASGWGDVVADPLAGSEKQLASVSLRWCLSL